jgi:ferric-dicitrate binding protein FerR (iron transport regulator)
LGIELQDLVSTAEGGRVKILFIDDSVLTLAEKSRMSVDTFIHSRSDRGKSLFNLLDGKMRAVVGKTKFEVKTPTVVAAARGTVILFEVGTINGRAFTRVTCLEGIVDIRKLTDEEGAATVMLTAGESILVMAGQPLPTPSQLSPAEIEKLKRDTSTSGAEIKLPDVLPREAITGAVSVQPIPVVPTFDRQQPSHPKQGTVNIGVGF